MYKIDNKNLRAKIKNLFLKTMVLFWLPDVICQPTEVVLWSLLSVEMFF